MRLHGVDIVSIDTGTRPIETVATSIIGIVGTAPDADAEKFPLNEPVLIAGSCAEAGYLDTVGNRNGTLPKAVDMILDQTGAMIYVVRVEQDADPLVTQANMIGGYNATTGQYTGVHALKAAGSKYGARPRILVASGFTHEYTGGLKNAVAAELEVIANSLRAIAVIDLPGTTDDAAIAARALYSSKRTYLVDPQVVTVDGDFPASAIVAGVIARTDQEIGWWASPSNKEILGILGISRAIDFDLSDPNCRANLLNNNEITTIINDGGFQLWGNRTVSADPLYAFLCVVRTRDILEDSVAAAHKWAVDRGIKRTLVEDVVEGVNSYLRHLTKIGAILGGEAWADPELNTPDQIKQGHLWVDFDFTPTYPAENITFRSHMVDGYINEVFQ